MSTLEERKELLSKRIAEISKVYEDNKKNAIEVFDYYDNEAWKLINSKNPFYKKQKMQVVLSELNHAEISRYVNGQFVSMMQYFKDVATFLLDIANDVEQHVPEIEKHRDFFHTILKTLDAQKQKSDEESLRKEQDQKRIKDLTGTMYG